jgi:hypothetical protein
VHPVRSKKDTAAACLDANAAALAETGTVEAAIRVPDAVGPLVVQADLRTKKVITSVAVEAPREGEPRAQLGRRSELQGWGPRLADVRCIVDADRSLLRRTLTVEVHAMAALAMVLPILPGKTESWRRGVTEMAGPRRPEFGTARRRQTVTRQRGWLQQTPQGDMEILYFEVDDPARLFQDVATSQEPFDRWLRQFVLEHCGLDLSQPMPDPPELMLDWSSEE